MPTCHYRWVVFAITFISYASTHACRQSFASAKNRMERDWGFSKQFEGAMDGIFLFSYALGLFSSGVIGDKFDTANVHAFGLLATSIIYVIFAMSVPYFHLNSADYTAYYILLWIINGFIQSIGWPTGVKLIGNWFTFNSNKYQPKRAWFIFKGYDSIGLVFGIWAAHQYIGNIIGIGYVTLIEHFEWKIQNAFYLPAMQAFVVSLLVFLFVSTYPNDAIQESENDLCKNANIQNLTSEHLLKHDMELKGDEDQCDENEPIVIHEGHGRDEYGFGVESDSDESVPSMEYRLSFRKALRLPNVVLYGLFFACLKGVNYTIFFWFGYFGSVWNDISDEESGNFLILFNFGSIVGGFFCGYFTDRYKIMSKHGRSPIIFLFLLLSIPAVFALYFKPRKFVVLYACICFFSGFFVGGPTNLISSVMATDIGKLQEVKGNPASFSTVSGIIDGFGSVGAAISDYAALWIAEEGTLQFVYTFLAGELLIGSLLIFPMVRRDMKGIIDRNVKDGKDID